MARIGPIVAAAIAFCFVGRVDSAQYLGKFLGKLSELHHGVSGEVYAVDGRTLHIKDFAYDGQGPAAYFYASTYKAADSRGFRLRDENNNGDVIKRYRKEGVTLTLPEGKTLNNIKIFYVWCEEFDVNFGDVKIPRNFDFPRPQKIHPLKGVHSISSDNIVIVDAQTLLIPNLNYDGQAPDAKFWVGRGPKPSPQGIRVPDENGKELPLRRYDGKTIVLTLPGDLTVFDIGHFGIWCEQFTVDFGHIQIPQEVNIPPSLKMLGVSPQSKLNCEVLNDDLAFEVRWAVAGESIVLQLVAKLGGREYMSFGLSGDDSKSVMIGGDVVVAWVDKETLKGYADDYYLADKSQCSGPTGSCPDTRLGDDTNNIRLLNAAMVNGYSIVTYQRPLKASDQFDVPIYTNHSQAIIWALGPLNQRDEVSFHSSYLKRDSFIDFARPAKWNCPLPEGEQHTVRQSVPLESRRQTVASKEVPVSAEPEEEEPPTTSVSRRGSSERRRGGGNRVSARQPVAIVEAAEDGQATRRGPTRTRGTNRVSQRGTASVPPPTPVQDRNAWFIPPIECYEPDDGVFYAQMGPTGGKRGYPAITGHVGWGISWYINGLLIPIINVVRGTTYSFVVEGGDDPEVSAKYHPFYITDDPVGGYEHKTPEEKRNVSIFAGASRAKDGTVHPTGTGRLCHWTETSDKDADDYESFGAYQRTLQLKCDQGEPGLVQWTPDKNTPDTVYYQCFTHRYLGWKINVLDSCDGQTAASEPKPFVVEAPKDTLDLFSDKSNVEMEASPSIRQETRVNPNNFISEESKAHNKQSQPTISEILTTLDPTTPSEQIQDQLSNTSLLFQSPHSHLIHSFGQVTNFAHQTPYTTGHLLKNYTSRFRPSSTTSINTERNNQVQDVIKQFVANEKSTERQLTQFVPEVQASSLRNFNYFPISMPILSQKRHRNTIHRPQPQIIYVPIKHTILKTENNLQYSTIPAYYKKPFFKQIPVKLHTPMDYGKVILNPSLKTHNSQNHQKRLIAINTPHSSVPFKTPIIPETVTMSEVKNVEISPQQASTEREPEIQTASSLLSVSPVPNDGPKLMPLVNTGFKPESIIIEGGFKPIINKEILDRMDAIEPEVKPESQVGVVKVEGEKKYKKAGSLGKMFKPDLVPFPLEKKFNRKSTINGKSPLKKHIFKITVRTRSLINSDIEPEMAAADRVESYYLPPPGQTKSKSIAKQPSNIDIEGPSPIDRNESPPDVVVTYDGKRVSGASLTAKPFDRSTVFEQRGSKAAEFIKAQPQFVPFKGDLPPLNPDVLFNPKSKQLETPKAVVLSRDLDTPLLTSGATKLRRIRRSPHHTPEHTAEQNRRWNLTVVVSGADNLMYCYIVSLVLGPLLLRYL